MEAQPNSTATHEHEAPPTGLIHFLLVPFPAQGHINPMLSFATQLLRHGGPDTITITCVLSERAHRAMLDAAAHATYSQPNLRFVTIHDGLPVDNPEESKLDMSPASWGTILTAIKEQEGFFEHWIENSMATSSPISCVVSDSLLPWMQDVANKFGIPCALFWSTNATLIYIGCMAKAGGIYPGSPKLEEIDHELRIRPRAVLDTFDSELLKDGNIMYIYERLEEASHILVNTFDVLEGHVLQWLPQSIRYIGPCLPLDLLLTSATSDQNSHSSTRAGNLVKEDLSCLKWLDKQDPASVLFISFGSVAILTRSQTEEIALGVEMSNYKFLWVVRHDVDGDHNYPDGFFERTKERGLVVSWAPQLRVLGHQAVGGFLTHCGWNSVTEAMYMGVPMLCFPLFAEQALNAELIVAANTGKQVDGHTEVGVGVGFKTRHVAGIRSGAEVGRKEVEMGVRTIMGDQGLRERAQQLKWHTQAALELQQGGSSVSSLISFIEDIRILRLKKETEDIHSRSRRTS